MTNEMKVDGSSVADVLVETEQLEIRRLVFIDGVPDGEGALD